MKPLAGKTTSRTCALVGTTWNNAANAVREEGPRPSSPFPMGCLFNDNRKQKPSGFDMEVNCTRQDRVLAQPLQVQQAKVLESKKKEVSTMKRVTALLSGVCLA